MTGERGGWHALDLAIAVCAGLAVGLALAAFTRRDTRQPLPLPDPPAPAAD